MRGRRSRGYLLTWLGSLTGMVIGGLVAVGIAKSTTSTCEGNVIVCETLGGLVEGVLFAGLFFGALVVGLVVGPYVALRFTKREYAGLTAALILPVCIGLGVITSVVTNGFPGWLVGLWIGVSSVSFLLVPVIARYVALRAAKELRRYA